MKGLLVAAAVVLLGTAACDRATEILLPLPGSGGASGTGGSEGGVAGCVAPGLTCYSVSDCCGGRAAACVAPSMSATSLTCCLMPGGMCKSDADCCPAFGGGGAGGPLCVVPVGSSGPNVCCQTGYAPADCTNGQMRPFQDCGGQPGASRIYTGPCTVPPPPH